MCSMHLMLKLTVITAFQYTWYVIHDDDDDDNNHSSKCSYSLPLPQLNYLNSQKATHVSQDANKLRYEQLKCQFLLQMLSEDCFNFYAWTNIKSLNQVTEFYFWGSYGKNLSHIITYGISENIQLWIAEIQTSFRANRMFVTCGNSCIQSFHHR